MVGFHINLIKEVFHDFDGGRRALDDDGVGDVVRNELGAADEEGLGSRIDLWIGKCAAAR